MTKVIENKDQDLKAMCKTLFSQMGFNTHYEIKLRNKSYISTYKTHDVSDIDVYGYKFNVDLSFSTVGSECKSGENSALEEFYKFLGIVDFYKIDTGYLVKSKIHQNAREIASRNSFRCFTEAEIRKVLLGFNLDVDKQIRIENAKYYRLKKVLKKYKDKNEKLIDYLTLDFWNKENWKNVHNLVHLLQVPAANPGIFDDSKIAVDDKLLFYYVLELFSISLVKNISEAMVLNYSDIEGATTNSLYGGAESLNERRKIHDLVNQVSKENREFEPTWHSDFVNVSSRIAQSTYAASKVPDMIQELWENSFYESSVKIDTSMLQKYPDMTRKFVQDLMQFLTKNCNLSNSIFEDFMKL